MNVTLQSKVISLLETLLDLPIESINKMKSLSLQIAGVAKEERLPKKVASIVTAVALPLIGVLNSS